MTIDKVAWSDLTKDKGLPAPIIAVLVGEPRREISVQMRYCDLLLIKQLVDKMVEETERCLPARRNGKSMTALKQLTDKLKEKEVNE